MTSGTGSGLVSRNKEGTQIVLARFPVEGETLTSFGLTPSVIKSIAIPNDIQNWPTTALNGCTNLEQITAFGEEIDEIKVTLGLGHFQDCSKLSVIRVPSSAELENGVSSVKSVTCSKNQKTLGVGFCRDRYDLTSFDFGKMSKLEMIDRNAFLYCPKLTSIDLSKCLNLKLINSHSFAYSSFVSVAFPPSNFVSDPVSDDGNRNCSPFNNTSIRTVIWMGTTRSPGLDPRTFHPSKTLDTLVAEGTITEIFVS